MGYYVEKQVTIHLVNYVEQECDDKAYYEVRLGDKILSKGETLEEAVNSCEYAFTLETDKVKAMTKEDFIETFAHFMSEHDLNASYDSHFKELGDMSYYAIKE